MLKLSLLNITNQCLCTTSNFQSRFPTCFFPFAHTTNSCWLVVLTGEAGGLAGWPAVWLVGCLAGWWLAHTCLNDHAINYVIHQQTNTLIILFIINCATCEHCCIWVACMRIASRPNAYSSIYIYIYKYTRLHALLCLLDICVLTLYFKMLCHNLHDQVMP